MKPDGWLGVELRHLAALQAVAREGSFGGAAVALGYSQSAVSQQIAALERIVGERLVERPGGPRPVSLTDAGKLLLGHAEGIVARIEAAQADLAAYSEGSAGTLRVGTYQSVGARVLPRVMLEFAAACPLSPSSSRSPRTTPSY
jgi:molybdate transport repressor ModE-like protein